MRQRAFYQSPAQQVRPDTGLFPLLRLLVAIVGIVALLLLLVPSINAPHVALFLPQQILLFDHLVVAPLCPMGSQNSEAIPDDPDYVAPLLQRPPPSFA